MILSLKPSKISPEFSRISGNKYFNTGRPIVDVSSRKKKMGKARKVNTGLIHYFAVNRKQLCQKF